MSSSADEMLLAPYRVLDLTDERGLLCGRILADLGADVLQVEPPEGSSARKLGPFYQDVPDRERSMFWWCYAANKRSITLDPSTSDGRALLLRLVKSSDFLVESFSAGYMESLGLGYEALREVNPRLVMVSISAFGQDGPYSQYLASDLTGVALGGLLYITGDHDRPPVRIGYPQFYLLGAAGGATGAMLAHNHRAVTGEGQYVDVSCQQAVAKALSQAPQSWDVEGVLVKRMGAYRMHTGGMLRRVNWACKDGYVNYQLSTGPGGGRSMRALLQWMDEKGMGDEELNQIDWEGLEYGGGSPDLLERIEPPVGRFFAALSKDELSRGSLEKRILLFPVNTPEDIFADPNMEARSHVNLFEHPDLDTPVTYLGPFIRDVTGSDEALQSGRVRMRRPAPRVGEHNREVYVDELGLAVEELVALRGAGVV